MAQFGRLYVPPWRAVLNVAWETLRSTLPERSTLIRRRNQTEMSTMPGSGQSYGTESTGYTNRQYGVAEDGFSTQDGFAVRDVKGDGEFSARKNYQGSRAVTMSLGSGGSFDELGCGEGGGKRNKINEWQAAWNVTNAIQVTMSLFSFSSVLSLIIVAYGIKDKVRCLVSTFKETTLNLCSILHMFSVSSGRH